MTASKITFVCGFQRHSDRKIAERKEVGQFEISPYIRISQTVYFGGKFARVMRNGKGYLAKTLLRKSLRHGSRLRHVSRHGRLDWPDWQSQAQELRASLGDLCCITNVT